MRNHTESIETHEWCDRGPIDRRPCAPTASALFQEGIHYDRSSYSGRDCHNSGGRNSDLGVAHMHGGNRVVGVRQAAAQAISRLCWCMDSLKCLSSTPVKCAVNSTSLPMGAGFGLNPTIASSAHTEVVAAESTAIANIIAVGMLTCLTARDHSAIRLIYKFRKSSQAETIVHSSLLCGSITCTPCRFADQCFRACIQSFQGHL